MDRLGVGRVTVEAKFLFLLYLLSCCKSTRKNIGGPPVAADTLLTHCMFLALTVHSSLQFLAFRVRGPRGRQ